ncbi:MAG: tryptophan-rich sensory protein [Inquilinus sp.]|nr:tryptophan-rich sensory protein [Inquilinus sp.]
MTPRPTAQVLVLAGFLLACLAVSLLGGLVTATSVGTWYPTLAKPPFNPPAWLFGPVWTALYAMMAVAGWRVWRRAGFVVGRRPLIAFAVQLLLNLGWSAIFFGLRWPGGALVEIVLLLAAVAATMVLFWRIDRWAGWLFLPYLGWTAFAALLNASIWWLN